MHIRFVWRNSILDERESKQLITRKKTKQQKRQLNNILFFRSASLSLCVFVSVFFFVCELNERNGKNLSKAEWNRNGLLDVCIIAVADSLVPRLCAIVRSRHFLHRSDYWHSFFSASFFVYVFGIKEKYIDDFHCFYLCNFSLKLNLTRRMAVFSTLPYYREHDAPSF